MQAVPGSSTAAPDGARGLAAPRIVSGRGVARWRWLKEAPIHAVLLTLLLLTFLPFVAMLVISGKDVAEYMHNPWSPTAPFHWDNYSIAWSHINIYVVNSIVVSGASCLGVLVLSTLSAYVFARHRFPGRGVLFYLIIGLLMVPGILTLIPQFILVRDLHLLNTRWALILPYISAGQVFGIFLLRSFFASLPEELFEAARIDGANDAIIVLRLVLPLSWSILATLAIFQVLSTWNDLIWPVFTIDDDSLKTIMTGLLSFQGQFATDYGPMMAGYTLASLPLLLLFAVASRYFVRGLTSGALKV